MNHFDVRNDDEKKVFTRISAHNRQNWSSGRLRMFQGARVSKHKGTS